VCRRFCRSDVKALGSTKEVHSKPQNWSVGEEGGIVGVEVKFVDIDRNTCGESGLLDKH
jgi:hypothetical protein